MLVVLPLCWMPADPATTEPPVGPACTGCCRIINAAIAVMVAKRGRTRRAIVEAPDVTSGPARRQHLRITQRPPRHDSRNKALSGRKRYIFLNISLVSGSGAVNPSHSFAQL